MKIEAGRSIITIDEIVDYGLAFASFRCRNPDYSCFHLPHYYLYHINLKRMDNPLLKIEAEEAISKGKVY